MKFIKKIVNGVILKSEDLKEWIKKAKEGFYEINIKKYGTRSLAQNSYYRLCMGILEKETGIDKEELHWYFKVKFLGEENGRPSTRELNKNEMVEYMEKIKDYSAMQGILLPDPIN